MKYTFKRGSNQYSRRSRGLRRYHKRLLAGYFLFFVGLCVIAQYYKHAGISEAMANGQIISPLPVNEGLAVVSEITPEPQIIVVEKKAYEPSEKEKIVAYITRKWEKHGTDQVVRAINCFYSESGLRAEAVGQNSDGPKSKDHGVAQLNDYWHKLTEEQKTDIYANIDKAYDIWMGRGAEKSGWEAWYGKNCS